MSKFNTAGAGGSSILAELERQSLAQPELPTTSPEQAAAQTAPAPEPVQAQLAEDSIAPAIEGVQGQPAAAPPGFAEQVVPEVSPLEQYIAEEGRQSIPDMRSRWRENNQPVNKATASEKTDGGIFSRANAMADNVESGRLFSNVSLFNTPGYKPALEGATGPEIAQAISAEKEGALQAAYNRVGAVSNVDPKNPKVDPDFIKAGSIVTENTIFEMAVGDRELVETEADPVAAAVGQEQDVYNERFKKPQQVAKAQGNGRIGQQVALEYQRLKGNQNPEKIPAAEAETLGDAFKEMWAAQNPNLVRRTRDPKSNQVYLEFTPEGEDVIAKGASDRKKLFPNKNVKPSKVPLVTGRLLGDTGQNIVKNVQGAVGKQEFGKAINQAIKNLGQVPNVVDKQRQRILYATTLPVLQQFKQNPEIFNSWEAEINNIGSSKLAKYRAAEAQASMDPDSNGKYSAAGEMEKAAQKLANEVKSIAENRKGANFFSYATQGFQGRISPQQTHFNATTSKAVRFVTRNAVPSIAKPGSRVETNLRQMYAMMLVKGADGKLPNQREVMLEASSAQLEKWGDKLSEALQMTEAEAEAISQAIEQGLPVNDPSFPQVKPLGLDPNADAELINAIKSKGEDGPHFIDGLMDFANYQKAKRQGKPHNSYFNAYIDGKTNGIASNGVQMGNIKTAEQTGTLRWSDKDYLDTHGDVRDVLKRDLLEAVDLNGFDGNVHEYSSELSAVARAVFSHRDLNKKTTMTFGYGKEVDTFAQDMVDTVALFQADPTQIKDPELREAFIAGIPTVNQKLEPQELGETLMGVYGPALEGVMSPEALASRAIMRSAAVMHAATDQLLSIKSYTGMDLNFGRDVQESYEMADKVKYRLKGEAIEGKQQEFTAAKRKSTPSSAAVRNMGETEEAGGYAYGGSVVGPVQSLDAATVAMSTSGKSWDRMSSSSGGNPYMHTIYDAFKVDAMGYDVALEEINSNWLEATMNWSYLKETKKATQDKMSEWKQKMASRNPNEKLEPRESTYMKFLLEQRESRSGKLLLLNYYKKIGTAGNFSKRTDMTIHDAVNQMKQEMGKVGYDINNPPAEPTVTQLRVFVGVLEKQLKTNDRFDKAINFTEKNKAKLKKEIQKRGYRTPSGKTISLQYYAH